ncbi:MAG: hypothetical protein JWO36_7446 [Myxococcales bacterium]|nr:hypothetical protein [Myxococcales bacterium]
MSQAAADALVVEGNSLFRGEQFAEAVEKFERATIVFPQHPLAWKGLGHALLCLGRPHEAAPAFDRAVGLRPESATALWGGALAHAELGNKVVALNYLRRTLALQPSWITMAQGVPSLQPFLMVAARAADLIRKGIGAYSGKSYRHTDHDLRSVEIGRLANSPVFNQWTFVTIGLSNTEWNEPERPRVELILASTVDHEVCGQILANLAFHLSETRFFPEPGTIVRDVVGALNAGDLSQRLPHVYVRSPRAWNLHLPLDIGPPAITLAQVFPISEPEYQMWRTGGSARFDQYFVENAIDIAELRRA